MSAPAKFSLARVIVPILLAAAAGGAYYAWVVSTEGKVEPVDVTPTLREFAKRLSMQETMAKGYTDADGDLLADPPKGSFLNPQELAFSVVAGDDPAEAEKTWQPLMDHLSKAAGRPVKYLKTVPNTSGTTDENGKPAESDELRGTEQQIAAVHDGRLHITAFNTGAVPLAVNAAGFHPLFVPANEAGEFAYQMQVIVPGSSAINAPGDLKGKTIGLVALSSNSGGRAPLMLLKEKFDLMPGRDYQYSFTGRHERSIDELVGGKVTPNFEAACVASDIVKQMQEDQRITEGRMKVIFTSSSFPKLTFGLPHNLDPELRKKLDDGFRNFRFTGTPLAKKFAAEKRVKFAPITYSQAYADVLAIDRQLITLLGGEPGK